MCAMTFDRGSLGLNGPGRVLVAMSGGVDSSVAAALCAQAGHEVVGATLKLWGGPQDQGCCAVSDVDDARRVCQQLGIDHFVFNYADEFGRSVVEPYVDAHRDGLTPNPCIACNRHVKFDALLERSKKLGFDRLVTGHHVRVGSSGESLRVRRGADGAKDQSYVLYMLSSEDLEHLWFPVGDYHKDRLREIAAGLGLRTANKAESQDVCFITSGVGRGNFLSERMELHAGDVVDKDGSVVGTAQAVELVTIGQRRGLGVGGSGKKLYAVGVDVGNRRVTVGEKEDLLCDGVALVDHRWADRPYCGATQAQFNAHGRTFGGVLGADGQLMWDVPQQRVAAGQAVVFYDGDEVIGGATSAGNLK